MPRSEALSRGHHLSWRHGVDPRAAPGMAPDQATEREPTTTRCAMLLKRLEGVGGARGPVAAGRGTGRGEGLIPEDEPAQDAGHRPRSSAPTASATAAFSSPYDSFATSGVAPMSQAPD